MTFFVNFFFIWQLIDKHSESEQEADEDDPLLLVLNLHILFTGIFSALLTVLDLLSLDNTLLLLDITSFTIGLTGVLGLA